MRRLGAGVHARLAVHHLARERINFLLADALVAPFPGFAEIAARENLAAIGSAEQRPAVGLENDRAEVLPRHHGFPALPRAAALVKREDAVHGSNQQLIPGDFSLSQRLPSGRQTYKHDAPPFRSRWNVKTAKIKNGSLYLSPPRLVKPGPEPRAPSKPCRTFCRARRLIQPVTCGDATIERAVMRNFFPAQR